MKLLQVLDISKTYGKVEAVKSLSFDVNEGEIIGLLGQNGAGKSTLLSMITTLLKPDCGDIVYRNSSIVKMPKVIQSEMGFVPQEVALYELLSGRENLKFWGGMNGLNKKELGEAIEEICELMGLNDRIDDKVMHYSGGMKRRLNIGVALLHKPKILILDEPTVGIDPQSRQHILRTIRHLNKENGTTVIFSSHYIKEVEEISDRISILHQGKLIGLGTRDELYRVCQLKTMVTFNYDQQSSETSGLENNQLQIKNELNLLNCVNVLEYDKSIIKLEVSDASSSMIDIMRIIHKFSIHYHKIDIKEPNLESVFFYMTNSELSD
jgi:ABC-2 type transport system ATP-binding protein